jgi:hypothetical protein
MHFHARRNKRTKEYTAWRNLKNRCLNPNGQDFRNYGGRGITLSDQFANSFEEWLREVGYAPTKNHEIDRIDNSKGYMAGNMRWVTRKQNQRNTRRNRIVTIDGVTGPLRQVCENLGLVEYAIRNHIYKLKRNPQEAADFLRSKNATK